MMAVSPKELEHCEPIPTYYTTVRPLKVEDFKGRDKMDSNEIM